MLTLHYRPNGVKKRVYRTCLPELNVPVCECYAMSDRWRNSKYTHTV